MFGGKYDCVDCLEKKRRQDYVCYRRGGTVQKAMQCISGAEHNPDRMAMYAWAGVCPRTMAAEVSLEFIQSVSWFDKGALGIAFNKIPSWYKNAISIFDSARAKASEIRMEQK